MRVLQWYLENFSAGVHSYQSRQPQGDVFAHELQNVRAGPEGHLRHWSPVSDVVSAPILRVYRNVDPFLLSMDAQDFAIMDRSAVAPGVVADDEADKTLPAGVATGIAASEERVHVLWSNGVLTRGASLVCDDDLIMRGRLWLIGEFRDFEIISSEGEDRGYWMDVRDTVAEDALTLHPLGLDPPAVPDFGSRISSANGLEAGLYVYAMTNVRAFFDDPDRVDLPPQIINKEFRGEALFNGMESNPTYFVVKVGGADGDVFVGGELITDVVSIAVDTGPVLSNVEYPHASQTGIYVYRTDVIPVGGRKREYHVETMEFRAIDFLYKLNPNTGHADVGGLLHSAISLADRPLLRTDNDVLPEQAFMIAYYNDLVFAAVGDELRYSDVRNGAPVQWAFPVANAIRIAGRVDFCAEYEGVLLFGSATGMWRLTGTDEFNFTRDQFSALGPVSRTAWGKLAKGIGFITSGGLYLTDGVNVEKVSPAVLDRFFEGRDIVDGAVQLLSDGDELWGVEFDDGVHMQFLKSNKGGWFIHSGINLAQSARFVSTAHEGHAEEVVYFVDNTAFVRRFDRINEALEGSGEREWFWESQELSWDGQGEGESLKTFKWLEIASSLETDVAVKFVVDGVERFVEATLRPGFRPTRVPIRSRGTRLQFRVSGEGSVEIRGLRVLCEVRDSQRRY